MNDPQPEGQMASHIGRRKFLATLGGAAATWPLAARAQQSAMPVIGWLSTRAPSESDYLVAAFRQGLKEAGYIEGQNVALEYRWAEGQYERLSAYAAELVRRPVTVIVATGAMPLNPRARCAGPPRSRPRTVIALDSRVHRAAPRRDQSVWRAVVQQSWSSPRGHRQPRLGRS